MGGILFLISLGIFILSYFQFKEKGFLFNNAYLYASSEARRKMNKKPYYRQSGIIFINIGFIFFLDAIYMMIQKNWIYIIIIGLLIFVIVYAIYSSIKIEKLICNKKEPD